MNTFKPGDRVRYTLDYIDYARVEDMPEGTSMVTREGTIRCVFENGICHVEWDDRPRTVEGVLRASLRLVDR